MFSFSFPLGSASTTEDKLMLVRTSPHPILKHGQLNAVPNYSSLNFVLENRAKQVECLAKNIYFEARNEPFAGQFAVALVTLNRVSDTAFPNTICEVVQQGPTLAWTENFPVKNIRLSFLSKISTLTYPRQIENLKSKIKHFFLILKFNHPH